MSVYKLHYFSVTGRGEVCRYLFKLGDQPYEDIRYKMEEWPAKKPDTPFGQLPYMEVDGELICQSHTMERLLAKRFNRYGDNDIEQARSDMIIDCCDDVLQDFFINTNGDDEGKIERRRKWVEDVLPGYLAKLEKFATPTGFIAGKTVMLPDLILLSAMELIEIFTYRKSGQIDLKETPKLQAIIQTVVTDPKISQWMKERPASIYPENM